MYKDGERILKVPLEGSTGAKLGSSIAVVAIQTESPEILLHGHRSLSVQA